MDITKAGKRHIRIVFYDCVYAVCRVRKASCLNTQLKEILFRCFGQCGVGVAHAKPPDNVGLVMRLQGFEV